VVAVAMITPGPIVITVAFIGYLAAGPAGAFMAALGVFLPCYLLVVIPARYFRRAVHDPRVKLFVDGVTVAAAGAIAGAVVRALAPRGCSMDRRSPSRSRRCCS
jgi:chromate transporter